MARRYFVHVTNRIKMSWPSLHFSVCFILCPFVVFYVFICYGVVTCGKGGQGCASARLRIFKVAASSKGQPDYRDRSGVPIRSFDLTGCMALECSHCISVVASTNQLVSLCTPPLLIVALGTWDDWLGYELLPALPGVWLTAGRWCHW